MIPYETWGIVFGLIFYLASKFLCIIYYYSYIQMYNKKRYLNSIPEKSEPEEILQSHKYVPKNKHEVLKAKYKCLKKLFQIYDASIIGMLPNEPYEEEEYNPNQIPAETRKHSRRKKRSYRTKSDASAGTNEISNGDIISLSDKDYTTCSVLRDLKVQRSCSTQVMTEPEEKKSDNLDLKTCSSNFDDYVPNHLQHDLQMSYLMMNEPKKQTRLQSFMQRLFGFRREKMMPNGHMYAHSDYNLGQYYVEKRRRRGLRFRRLRKSKKVHSEMELRDLSSPTIMSYVQSVQKNCLMDKTPRQCPTMGCNNVLYGIINYNDHLNLCHFSERKFICHYCHEGFEAEIEKLVHENEHLGFSKLKSNINTLSAPSSVRHSKSNDTQTDPPTPTSPMPEEKFKKIVSFFDKMVDSEQMISEYKNERFYMTNFDYKTGSESISIDTGSSDKRTRIGKSRSLTVHSGATSNCQNLTIKCHLCGEEFDYRRQLGMHLHVEHGVHNKFSKFHSCAGITDCRRRNACSNGTIKSETGKINIQSHNESIHQSSVSVASSTHSTGCKSVSLTCDPSSDSVYCDSLETIKNHSNKSFASKVASGATYYYWEPGTKIIRV